MSARNPHYVAKMNSHFLSDKLQPSIHRPFCLNFILLEKHRSDKLVDGLFILERVELLLDPQVLLFLGLKFLSRCDCCLKFCSNVSWVTISFAFRRRYAPDWSFWKSSDRAWSLACNSAMVSHALIGYFDGRFKSNA